jgi:hypothetical protein
MTRAGASGTFAAVLFGQVLGKRRFVHLSSAPAAVKATQHKRLPEPEGVLLTEVTR